MAVGDNDDVIEHAVVKISPDLTGFRRDLAGQLERALAGKKIELPIELNKAALHNLKPVRDELEKFEKQYAEARRKNRAFDRDAEKKATDDYFKQLQRRFDLQRSGAAATARQAQAAEDRHQRILKGIAERTQREARRVRSDAERFEKDRADAGIAERQREAKRIRSISEAVQSAHVAALDRSKALDAAEAARQEREAVKRTSILEREAQRRKSALGKFTKGPQIIDWGGKGFRPMNLLRAAGVALTPVLFAVSASAVQASTSLAALGAASIGSALAVGGLVVAFQSIVDVWALRKTVQKEAAAEAANASQKAVENANEEVDRVQSILAAERDLHEARRQAKRDLEELRSKVADLQNQEKEDTVSIAEAQSKRNAVYRNFFASALDRRRADQDVANAINTRTQHRTERKQAKEDLKTGISEGVENSDRVLDARDRLRRARNAKADAAAATVAGKTSSAAANLQTELAKMSPAGRELYFWLDKNAGKFTDMRNIVEQGVLPGVLKFLKAITRTGGQKSTLEIVADAAGELAGIVTSTLADFGEWTNSPLFRKSFATIQGENVKAFRKLGDAAITFLDPITRIVAASAPLFTDFATWLDTVAVKFDKWAEKAEKDGSLKTWFEDARIEMGKWWSIAENILVTVRNLMMTSLPSGQSLVDRLRAFTGEMRAWTEQPENIAKIQGFFDFFKNLKYGEIATTITRFTELFLTISAFRFLKNNALAPLFTAIGLLASQNQGGAIGFLEATSSAIKYVFEQIEKYPTAAATLLTLLTAYKGLSALGSTKLPIFRQLGDFLGEKFKPLQSFLGGGAKTGVMNVQAGVVNVYGGAGLPGGKGAKPGAAAGLGAVGLTSGLIAAAVAAAVAVYTGIDQGNAGKSPFKIDDPIDLLRFGSPIGLLANEISLWRKVGFRATVDLNVKQAKELGKGIADALGLTPDPLPAQEAENKAFRDVKGDISRGRFEEHGNWLSLGDAVRRREIENYIAKRKESVRLAVENARASGGEAAAQRVLRDENVASVHTLSDLLSQYTGNREKAAQYARAIFEVNREMYNNRIQQVLGRNDLSQTGEATDVVAGKVKNLQTKLAELNGQYVVTVTSNKGSFQSVFSDLTTALAYQHLLGTGQEATQGNLAKVRHGIQKQSATNALAEGGPVRGPGTATSDSIVARLSHGEYVQPTSVVQHYGVDYMERLRRKEVPKFAKGGAVWPMTVRAPAEAVKARAAMWQSTGLGGTAVGDEKVAEIAEATARAMGANDKQLLALIEAGIVESGLRNLTYGDRDSIGFLQQRASWGSRAARLDVAAATRKFISKARTVDRQGYTAGQLAQAVQVSAFPDRYDARMADAIAVLNRTPPFYGGLGAALGNKGGGAGWRWQQAALEQAFGDKMRITSSTGGGHSKGSWHYKGRAVDIVGPMMQIFQWIKSNHGLNTKELIYSPAGAGIKNGKLVDIRSFYGRGVYNDHFDHVHWAYNKGGEVKARKYDSGGDLPPGYTLAFNGTGRTETVRTHKQEKQLNQPLRIDRRDIVLIAQQMAAATSGQVVNMDGRRVAEITNSYTYLPTGV